MEMCKFFLAFENTARLQYHIKNCTLKQFENLRRQFFKSMECNLGGVKVWKNTLESFYG